MPSFVVDASAAAGWFIADEQNPLSTKAIRRLEISSAIVPDLFWHEMRSVLTIACRRKRITVIDVGTSMTRLRELNILTISKQTDAGILSLVHRYHMSAYDAAYLALAVERNIELATLDKQIISVAPQVGCQLLHA